MRILTLKVVNITRNIQINALLHLIRECDRYQPQNSVDIIHRNLRKILQAARVKTMLTKAKQ